MKYLIGVINYLPSLQHLELGLQNNQLGKSVNNMKYLAGVKFLSNNLFSIKLDLYNNSLGENDENMKYFEDCMKQLPSSLNKLQLNLSYNYL